VIKTLQTLLIALIMSTTLSQAESIYDLTVASLDGKPVKLSEYKGKVLLIVNVASKCGLTPQYKGLETLYQNNKDKGFVILGFPCNQFAGQEPGTATEIQSFCEKNYGVTFPLFEKLDVNGANRAPLYNILAGPSSPFPGDIKWNFGKFLIGTDGTIIARFEPTVTPDSPEITAAIDKALAGK